jgi:tRNA G26 N,N-dimethylase Trm1
MHKMTEQEIRHLLLNTHGKNEVMHKAYDMGFKAGMEHQQAKTDPEFAAVLNIIKTQETK